MAEAQTTQSAASSTPAVNRTKKMPEGYWRHWEQEGEALPDNEDARNTRKQKYDQLVNDYYDAATDLYLESWGQSFHMCRYPRGPENKEKATARHEHYLAHMMSLRSGMRVLDVGCGVGGPAKELAAFAGCQVVGLNNNGYPKFGTPATMSPTWVKSGHQILPKSQRDEVWDRAVVAYSRLCKGTLEP